MLKKIWNRFFARKKKSDKIQFDVDRQNIAWGSIFLGLILGVFLLVQTEKGIDDVSDFLDWPECPFHTCHSMSIDSVHDYFYDQQNWSEKHPLFLAAKKDFLPLKKVRNDIRVLERQIDKSLNEQINLQEKYNTTLLEDIADHEDSVYGQEKVQNSLEANSQEIDKIQNKIDTKKRNEGDLLKKYKVPFSKMKSHHDDQLKIYQAQNRITEIKLFALQFLITFPLFMIGQIWYRRSKENNSKYSILPLIIMIVGAITFLHVLVMYTSNWIAFEFFENIFKWLSKVPFGKLIIHYLLIFLGIGVFGFLIINLQKYLFSEKRIQLKRLNKKECPFCAFPLDFSDNYCSGCGENLKVDCGQCKSKTLKILKYCQSCGKDHSKNPKE